MLSLKLYSSSSRGTVSNWFKYVLSEDLSIVFLIYRYSRFGNVTGTNYIYIYSGTKIQTATCVNEKLPNPPLKYNYDTTAC